MCRAARVFGGFMSVLSRLGVLPIAGLVWVSWWVFAGLYRRLAEGPEWLSRLSEL